MTAPKMHFQTDGSHAHDFIYPESKHKTRTKQDQRTAWWVGAPRDGFTRKARQEWATRQDDTGHVDES